MDKERIAALAARGEQIKTSSAEYPYGYYDYDYPADAFGEPPIYPPPVVSSAPAAPSPPCQRSVEKFTVPSQDGSTRQITIINCP